MKKLSRTAALTGAFAQRGTGKGASPYLPITPEEMAKDTKRCVDAGASIVHLHARDPVTGAVSSDIGYFKDIVDAIRAECDVIFCLTTGGGVNQTVEERLAVVPEIKPEIASYTSGSVMFGIYDSEQKDWALDATLPISYKMLEEFGRVMDENDVIPELEIYSAGQLENIKMMLEIGALKAPSHFSIAMGYPGEVTSPSPHHLMSISDAIRREFPSDSKWSTSVYGLSQWPICTMAAILGADGVRTGMEDTLYLEEGVLARSNGELVDKLASLCTGVGREIASVEETRKLWGITRKC
jgi:uncharacterized protein (DUF849 family)